MSRCHIISVQQVTAELLVVVQKRHHTSKDILIISVVTAILTVVAICVHICICEFLPHINANLQQVCMVKMQNRQQHCPSLKTLQIHKNTRSTGTEQSSQMVLYNITDPDVVFIDEQNKTTYLIDIVVPTAKHILTKYTAKK